MAEVFISYRHRDDAYAAADISRRLGDEDWVRREIATAGRRSIPILPVVLQGAARPSRDDLPDDVAPLLERQELRIHDVHQQADVDRLLSAVAALVPEGCGKSRLAAELCRLQQQRTGRPVRSLVPRRSPSSTRRIEPCSSSTTPSSGSPFSGPQ